MMLTSLLVVLVLAHRASRLNRTAGVILLAWHPVFVVAALTS